MILEGYENVVPGAAERLIAMVEKEQSFRHKMEKSLLDAQIKDARQDRAEARLGQIFALVIGLTTVVTGGVTAVRGAQLAGGFIGSAGVASLVTVFVAGRKNKSAPKKSPVIEGHAGD
jgi:uncharacterized membrane protein